MEKPPENIPEIVEDPQLMLRQIRSFIQECENVVARGEAPDLEGLDAQVAELCRGIEEMAPAEYEKMKPKLESLSQELTGLGRELEKQKRDIEIQIASLAQQQKANVAYQKTGASVPPPKKDQN